MLVSRLILSALSGIELDKHGRLTVAPLFMKGDDPSKDFGKVCLNYFLRKRRKRSIKAVFFVSCDSKFLYSAITVLHGCSWEIQRRKQPGTR